MLWAIVAILVILWLLGAISNVVGGLVHALLVIIVIVAAIQLLRGRSTSV